MKPSLFLFSLLTRLIIFAQDGNGEQLSSEGLKRLPYESGVIVYEVSGEATGIAKVDWSHWGWKEASRRDLTFVLFGMTNSTSSLDARDGDMIYSADLLAKKGQVVKEAQTSGLLRYKSLEQARNALYESEGGMLSGQDTILGKPVNIWKYESGKVLEIWEWDGIVLKSVRKLSNITYTLTALSIDLDTGVIVQFPVDITWN